MISNPDNQFHSVVYSDSIVKKFSAGSVYSGRVHPDGKSQCHQSDTSLVHVAVIETVRAHAVVVVHAVSTHSVVVEALKVSVGFVISAVSISSGLSLSSGLSISLPESASVKVTRRHAIVLTISIELARESVTGSVHAKSNLGISLRGSHSSRFGLGHGLPLVEVTEVVHHVPVVVEVGTRRESIVSGESKSWVEVVVESRESIVP